MKILSATFLYKNDEPHGIGLTFSQPGFTPEELAEMFAGETARKYMRDSDTALGTHLVETYIAQVEALALEAKQGPLPMAKALLVALNIMWLTERGLIPNDEFNGVMFVQQR